MRNEPMTPVLQPPHLKACRFCGGSGLIYRPRPRICPACAGDGLVEEYRRPEKAGERRRRQEWLDAQRDDRP